MTLHRFSVLVLVVIAATARGLAQSDVAIDDFKTGHYQSPAYTSGDYSSTQNGDMLGGRRDETLSLCDFATVCGSANAYSHTASYGVFAKTANHAGGLEESAGYGTESYLDVEYGIGGTMNVSFSGYDRIRVNFLGLNGPLTAEALLETNGGIDSYAENSCNLKYSDEPFSVEFPFDEFIASNGFDLGHVQFLAFTLDETSKVGGVGYAISSIELSDQAAKGAIVCKSLSEQ
jgi:hypothetical protein